MTMTCKEVTRLVSEGLDKTLPADQQARLQAHFALCRGCASLRDRFSFLRRAIGSLAERDRGED